MKKTISILLSLIMVFSVFTVIPVTTAGAAESYAITVAEGITHGTITVPASAEAGSKVTVAAEPEGSNELGSISVKAESYVTLSASLNALDGTAPGNSNETYTKLVDGNTDTKWCLNMEGTPYIILKAEESISMTGYSLTTANDTQSQSGRNWKDWTICGANFDSDSNAVQDSSAWQVIASVTDDDTLQAENFTTYDFAFDAPAESYQYYMIRITANHGNGMIQMSEFGLKYAGMDFIENVDVSGAGNTRTFTMPSAPVRIDAVFGVPYSYSDGSTQYCCDPTVVTSETTALTSGWYAVMADTEISSRITCSGDVNLILCNGTTLTAHKGITVSGDNNSLSIWQQAEEANKKTGKLIIDQVDSNFAGIGGDDGGAYGSGNSDGSGDNITINGGTVNVTGGYNGAGIGGGCYGSGENITINGGIVTATGGSGGAGVGGGCYGSGENITISGGNVTANGGLGAAGIGGGYDSSGSSITLNWTNDTDSITASGYKGTVTLEKDFCAGMTFIPSGVLTDNRMIANKTLIPYFDLDYEYIDENGDTHTAAAYPISSRTNALSDGWYVVTADTEVSDRIICEGDVYLILMDGVTLTAPEGIAVNENDCLTIYGQAAGNGTLEITGSGSDYNAGIGGDQGCRSGVITINGGTVNVNIDNIHCLAAAIGGGVDGDGSVFINGGTVSASTSSGLGAGIGGAHQCGGFVEINGGNVTASSIGGGTRSIENHKISSVRLSWTNLSDSIKADSYIGNVTLFEDFRADSVLTPAGGLIDNRVIEGKKLTPPGFIGHSLSLNGDISINYFTLLSDEEIESGAVVDFTWTVEGEEKIDSVTLTAANKTANGYKATCPVPVAEMTYDITATLTAGGEQLATNTYSVRQYADTILSNVYKTKYIAAGKTEEQYNKLATLVKTMLDYGAKAQVNFNRDIGNLANAGLDYSMEAVTVDMIPSTASEMESGLYDYGLAYSGSTIVYLSKTSMRHYYKITDQAKFDLVKDNITFNGEKVEYKTKNGQIYFELTDIAAADLDTPYTLSIGTNDYQYSALDYVRACLSSVFVPYATAQLVSATYWYNQAANAYFNR